MKHLQVYLLLFFYLITFSTIKAESNIVTGIGLGEYIFSGIDDSRKRREDMNQTGENHDLDRATVTHFSTPYIYPFVEWYFIENTGIGYRHVYINAKRSASTSGLYATKSEETWNIYHDFFTFQQLMSFSNFKIGLIAGAGISTLIYQDSYQDQISPIRNFKRRYIIQGQSALGGSFIAWGENDLGFRIGAHYIYSPFKTIKIRKSEFYTKEFNMDGSGVALYFDVTWGFSLLD